MTAPGSRIGAILWADKTAVHLIGYGVYVGDEVPPEPMGLLRMLHDVKTWDDYDASLLALGLWRADQGPVPHPMNPKLVLDDGCVVWGCECWWGPEATVREAIGDRTVVTVDLARVRRGLDADVRKD